MLGWQRKQEVYGGTITTETLKRTAFERIGRKPKVTAKERLSSVMQPMGTMPGKEVFFSSMLEEILDIRNIQKAFRQVTANKGASGIDGMQTDELRDYLNTNWQRLRSSILTGNYKPQAVRKVEIPKPGGNGLRMIGIPNVIDRLLGQAIAQWLSPKYEPTFSENSFGFRPGRNAHQAVLKAQRNLNSGHRWIIELDLEKFFDRVNHDKVMCLLSAKVKDKCTLKLIRNFLSSGIMENGVVSPLISNILLD